MPLPPLSPEQRIRPPWFDLRMSALYAAIYIPMGIHLPYFPLWLDSQGFSADQVAVILSLPLFLRVLTTPWIAARADRANDRVDILLFIVVAAAIVTAGYFLPRSFLLVLVVSLTLQVVWSPQGPLADSLALSGVRRFGSDYARLRIWGSTSFFVANLIGGWVIASTGVASVPAMMTAGAVLVILTVLAAPRLGRPRRASPLSAADLAEAGAVMRRPYFLAAVAAAGLTNASHGFIYAFGTIYWSRLGLADGVIGVLWAVAVVAEVVVMFFFRSLFGSVRPALILALAAAMAVVRWLLFPFVWDSGTGALGFGLVQLFHAFSTGVAMLGVQKLIAEAVPEETTGTAQGVAFFATALGTASTMLVSGMLWTTYGENAFFWMAAVAAGGLACAFAAFAFQPQSPASGGETMSPE